MEQVLPKISKTKRFASFERQMNNYGFHKVKTINGESCEYYNTNFSKGNL